MVASVLKQGQKWKLELQNWNQVLEENLELNTIQRIDETEFDPDVPVCWLALISDGVHPSAEASAEGNADMAHALALKLASFLPVRRLSNVNTNRQHRKGWK